MNFSLPVPAQLEAVGNIDIYGFYKTAEGRNFLRALFGPFLNRVDFREGKVASIIADTSGSPDAQKREVEATRSALRRWHKNGQVELWPKDSEKNLRYLARIEAEMMHLSDFAEIFEDQVLTQSKVQVGNGLAMCFYGTNNIFHSQERIRYLHAQSEGTYQVLLNRYNEGDFGSGKYIAVDGEMLRKPKLGEDISEHQTTIYKGEKYIVENQHPSDAPAGYQVTATEIYYSLKRVPNQNFMLLYVLTLGPKQNQENGSEFLFSKIQGGYCYPMEDGSFFAVLGTHGPAGNNTIESFYLTGTEGAFEKHFWPYRKDVEKTWSYNSSEFTPLNLMHPKTDPKAANKYFKEEMMAWADPSDDIESIIKIILIISEEILYYEKA